MSILDQPIPRLDGTPGTLRDLTGGGPALLVNVASKCGLTPQYTGLEQLQEKYGHRGFTVVGLPCNQFGGQEPGSSEEIAEFCSAKYDVKFPMFEKIVVKGDGINPLYAFLTAKETNPKFPGEISWNFEKFLIGRDGQVVRRDRRAAVGGLQRPVVGHPDRY